MEAGHLIVDMTKLYYEQNDDSVLPRNVASKPAFENAIALDVAMGGCTNTVLHILAMAHEGKVDFTMTDIDRISRKVPCLCKVATAKQDVHMEDVHRAGGIMAILGQLDSANLLNREVPAVHSLFIGAAIDLWDISRTNQPNLREFFRAGPGGVRSATAFSTALRYADLDLDREKGVIRSAEHAFSKDGGLAVLSGNVAVDGCIVKTAGVDDSILVFSGLSDRTIPDRFFVLLRERLFPRLIRETRRHCGISSRAKPTARELELLMGLHGGIFYIGLRRWVYEQAVHGAEAAANDASYINDRIDGYLLSAGAILYSKGA